MVRGTCGSATTARVYELRAFNSLRLLPALPYSKERTMKSPSTTRPTTPNPDSNPEVEWYTLSVDDALQQQRVRPEAGLSAADVAERLHEFGPNKAAVAQKEPGWRAFLRQFRDPMQIVLLVAGVVSGVAIQQWGTAVVLIGLALFNAIMGLRQEGKAEASVAALQKMLLVKARVRRGGDIGRTAGGTTGTRRYCAHRGGRPRAGGRPPDQIRHARDR